jgi:F-type H+-transporting ATPase subunit delta
MNEIAKEYAGALFYLALEEKAGAEYAAALETIQGAFRENEDFLSLLASPAISLKERLGVVDTVFCRMPQSLLSFLKLLCEKGRISLFPDAAEEYRRLWEEAEKKERIRVTSAIPLTEEEKEKLIKKLDIILFQKRMKLHVLIIHRLLKLIVLNLNGIELY